MRSACVSSPLLLPGSAAGAAACPTCRTSARAAPTRLAALSTVASSASLMNAIAFDVPQCCLAMCDLPFEHEHLGLAQQRVVDDDRHERDNEPHGGRLQRQRKPDHDLADVRRGVDAELVEGEHDAQNGAEQS